MDWLLLAPLTDEERNQVLSNARPRHFAKGEVILHEGDPADSLHLVSEGRLAVRSLTLDGDAVMLNLLVPGDYFGELALLHAEPTSHRTATVLALEPAETLSLSASTFHQLCNTYPRVEHLLTTLLARRVEDLSKRLLETLYVGLDRRLYRRLVELCAIYGTEDGVATIQLTQEQLADLVGGSRPSVNQVLQKLASQNVLNLGRGRIEVADLAALKKRAGV